VEENDLIDAVDKFRIERFLEFVHDQLACFAVSFAAVEMAIFLVVFVFAAHIESDPAASRGRQQAGSNIGGHDDDRVAEIDRSALAVGQASVFQDLEQGIEDIRMGFFNFVKQDDRIGAAADFLRQLAAFFVTHIAWRRTNQLGHVEFLHVLGHIDPDHGIFVAKHDLSQCPGQFCLANTGGAEEDEGTGRTFRILEAEAAAPDRLGYGVDGRILADDPFADFRFEVFQFLIVVFGQFADGDLGPGSNDIGDHVGMENAVDLPFLLFEACFFLFDFSLQGQFFLAQGSGFLKSLPIGRFFFAVSQFGQLLLQFGHALRLAVAGQAQLGCSFVDQVDRLVRQESVLDVAGREHDGCIDRLVSNPDIVMCLVLLPQALEDQDRLLRRGFADRDRLEAPLQGLVFLDVLSVFIDRCGADDLQFTPRQHRFQDIGSIHRTFCTSGADDRVQLIDEQDDIFTVDGFVEALFQALLKFATVFAAGQHAGHVQGDDALALQRFGDVSGNDPLGQAFSDGGFTDTWFTDQARIVLRPPAQDLHHPVHLFLAANDRVEFAISGHLGQVAAEFVQGRCIGFLLAFAALVCFTSQGRIDFVEIGITRWTLAAQWRLARFFGIARTTGSHFGQRFCQLAGHGFDIDIGSLQDAHGHAFTFVENAEHQVLRLDHIGRCSGTVAGSHRGQVDDAAGPGCEHIHDLVTVDFALELDIFRFTASQLDQGFPDDICAEASGDEGFIASTTTLGHQASEQVLGSDIAQLISLGQLVSRAQHSSHPF